MISLMNATRGFTLVELLVVIAILAVLAVTVVVVLNPAELLRQARDSTRLSDMSSVNRALGLFLADGQTWSTASGPRCTAAGTPPMSGTCTVPASPYGVAGSGWVDLNFGLMSTGAPLGSLPTDPTNSTTYFYAFERSATTKHKLGARLESTKFASSSQNDGGSDTAWFEVGTDLAL